MTLNLPAGDHVRRGRVVSGSGGDRWKNRDGMERERGEGREERREERGERREERRVEWWDGIWMRGLRVENRSKER